MQWRRGCNIVSDVVVIRESYWRRVLPVLLLSFRAQWFFFVVPVFYLFGNWLMLSRLPKHGVAPVIGLLIDLLSFSLPVGMIVMLVMRLLQYALIEKPESPIRALGGELADLVRNPSRLINGLPVFAAMIFFNKAMVELKPAIPAIHPFDWDTTFMRLDRALHFGMDPWRLIQPVMGHDFITFAVNMAYNFWFVALFGAWFWFGFRKLADVTRTQFFLGYMIAWWVGGGLLAVAFSSAGPVYYGNIGLSPDPYAPLMAYIHDVNNRIPIWCLITQQLLWDGYTGHTDPLGISAFPSMHNASAILFALAFWKVWRPAGWFFAGYAVVILLGSVHLGWHYAVDGYAGLAIGAVAWWIAGYIARFLHRQPAMQQFNEGLAAL